MSAKDRPFEAVLELVRRVPPGRVVTYGDLSRAVDRRVSALAVGWALAGCPDDVPWHRVVNARGGLSTESRPGAEGGMQRRLLEAEGVPFRADGTVDLEAARQAPRVGSDRSRRRGGG